MNVEINLWILHVVENFTTSTTTHFSKRNLLLEVKVKMS
jgi:hypothetical protein